MTLAVLPKGHAIARHLERLAEANKSSELKARQKREEEEIKVTLDPITEDR